MHELFPELAGYALEPVGAGESGASVSRCTRGGAPTLYVKAAALADELHLDGEAERLRWMRDRGVCVPAVLGYRRSDRDENLLLDEAPGIPASDPEWRSTPREVVRALGRALADLHRMSIADCPFDHRVARRIEDARHQLQSGRVNENDFDERYRGRSAAELFDLLLVSIPREEENVFTHGDFTLENIFLERAAHGQVRVSMLIDCGRAGIGDRYQDLALAIRSVRDAFGEEWTSPLLDAYGLRDLNEKKVDFYQLLDELF